MAFCLRLRCRLRLLPFRCSSFLYAADATLLRDYAAFRLFAMPTPLRHFFRHLLIYAADCRHRAATPLMPCAVHAAPVAAIFSRYAAAMLIRVLMPLFTFSAIISPLRHTMHTTSRHLPPDIASAMIHYVYDYYATPPIFAATMPPLRTIDGARCCYHYEQTNSLLRVDIATEARHA